VIALKKCSIKNWDGGEITPLMQITDRIRLKLRYLNLVQDELASKSLNRRFHDEPKRTINDLIRWCHGAMGMYSGTSSGCLYIENDLGKNEAVVEHVVPVSDLVNLYFSKKLPLPLLLFLPVAKISKASNSLLLGCAKTNTDPSFPFRRYSNAGLSASLSTHSGEAIDLVHYSLDDHFALVRETASKASVFFNHEFAEVFDAFAIEELITRHRLVLGLPADG
jgi:hypothetical protein